MSNSTNYGFVKPELNQSADITVISSTIEAIDNTIKSVEDANLVQTASGTANAIVLTLPTTLVNGYQVTFVASANNSGSATIINSIYQLYKPATTTTPTLIKDKPYSIYYNSTGNCFFLKASSEGDALASHVLAGKKFSNDDDTGLTGTLDLSLLTSANIRSGITINGISGNSNVVNTSDAVLDPQYLLTGYSGYDDGVKKNGTMTNRGAVVITPSTSNQAIPKGFHNGSGYVVGDTDLRASNIINTANIFGVQGTAKQLKYASGTLVVNYTSTHRVYFTLPTQSFTVIAWFASGGEKIIGSMRSGDLSVGVNYGINDDGLYQSDGFTTTKDAIDFANNTEYAQSGSATFTWYAIGY